MRLSEFILAEMQSILLEWEQFARTVEPAASDMSDVDLRDHAAIMLRNIAEDLGIEQSRDEQIVKSHGGEPRTHQTLIAEKHGISQLESRFTIEQLVSEYRALRSSVIRLWSEASSSIGSEEISDIVRFNEAIDQLVASSVFSFARAAREAMEAEGRQKDQFLAMLAQELRNPLSPIGAAAELLKTGRLEGAAIQRTSEVIARQVRHMTGLVDQKAIGPKSVVDVRYL